MTKSIRMLVTAAVVVSPLALWAAQRGLGPTVMMFHGDPLKNPVILTGADVTPFGDLLVPKRPPSPLNLAGRTYVNVALFVGSASDPADNGTPVARLTPQMAWQHGRLYVATPTLPAILVVTEYLKMRQAIPPPEATAQFSSAHLVSPEALAVLKKHGVPTGSSK